MNEIIPWVLMAWTVATMWLAGSKNPLAWYSGIASQLLWLYFDWTVQAWGLMPLAIILTAVYWRNLRRWKQEQELPKFYQPRTSPTTSARPIVRH